MHSFKIISVHSYHEKEMEHGKNRFDQARERHARSLNRKERGRQRIHIRSRMEVCVIRSQHVGREKRLLFIGYFLKKSQSTLHDTLSGGIIGGTFVPS